MIHPPRERWVESGSRSEFGLHSDVPRQNSVQTNRPVDSKLFLLRLPRILGFQSFPFEVKKKSNDTVCSLAPAPPCRFISRPPVAVLSQENRAKLASQGWNSKGIAYRLDDKSVNWSIFSRLFFTPWSEKGGKQAERHPICPVLSSPLRVGRGWGVGGGSRLRGECQWNLFLLSETHLLPSCCRGGVKGGGAGEGGSLSPALPPSDDIPVLTGPGQCRCLLRISRPNTLEDGVALGGAGRGN